MQFCKHRNNCILQTHNHGKDSLSVTFLTTKYLSYIFKSFFTSHLSDPSDFGYALLSHCLLPHRGPHLGELPGGAGRGGVALVAEGPPGLRVEGFVV